MNRALEPRRLRYFIKVAELSSLTRAAEELHIAQPALSQHMRALEEEVGAKLLQRSSRGVVLTEAGQRMLEEGRELIAAIGATVKRVRESPASADGEVVIGVGQTIGSLLMVPLIEEASRSHPRVRIQVREMLSGLLPELVRAGGVDFAISYNTANGHGIQALPVLAEELCLVGQRRLAEKHRLPGSKVRFADIAQLPLFLSRRGHILREMVERTAAAKGLSLNLRAEVDSLYIMKELALGGTGFTILSRANFGRELEHHDVYIAPLTAPAIRREIALVRREGRPLDPAAAQMARLALEVLVRMVSERAWKGALRIKASDISKFI